MLMKNKTVTECSAQTPDAPLRSAGRARTALGCGRSGYRNPPRWVVDLNSSGTPLLIQEGWRAERRGGGGCSPLPKLQVAISTTPAPGATPPQLRRGAICKSEPRCRRGKIHHIVSMGTERQMAITAPCKKM